MCIRLRRRGGGILDGVVAMGWVLRWMATCKDVHIEDAEGFSGLVTSWLGS